MAAREFRSLESEPLEPRSRTGAGIGAGLEIEMTASSEAEHVKALEARVNALSSTLKSVLTTLVLRGILNRADVATLLHETEASLSEGHPAGMAELRSIGEEMPSYLRAAVGPPPDPDDDDH
jgi:hypothetical protein